MCSVLRPQEAVSPEARAAVQSGRLALGAAQAGSGLAMRIASIYGVTNGEGDRAAALATDAILEAAFTELGATGRGPAIIRGDLNTEPLSLPALTQALAS